LRGGIDGVLQLRYQLRNGAIQLVSDAANGSPVMRLLRANPNGLKQLQGGDVVGMGDEWDRHPFSDRLICRVDFPNPPAGSGREDYSARDCQHEGEPNSQYAPPNLSHNSI
jgi:hypothetical protein